MNRPEMFLLSNSSSSSSGRVSSITHDATMVGFPFSCECTDNMDGRTAEWTCGVAEGEIVANSLTTWKSIEWMSEETCSRPATNTKQQPLFDGLTILCNWDTDLWDPQIFAEEQKICCRPFAITDLFIVKGREGVGLKTLNTRHRAEEVNWWSRLTS